MISAVEKMDARPEDAAYGARTSEIETKKRINTLFSPEKDAAVADKDDYETVNEGMTTDTTEAPQFEMRRGTAGETSQQEAKAEPEEETGILSSDEEDSTVPKASKVVADKPLDHTEEVHSFGGAQPLFASDKAREEVENQYNFGEQDLERFGDKLKSKASRSENAEAYAAKSEITQEALDSLDMHSLNLFGLPLEETSDTPQVNADTKRVLQELIEVTDEVAGNSIANFQQRKAFAYYDPYEPDESVTYAYLKFEDHTKLRASVVLDYFMKEVEAIPDASLTYADKERKEQVVKLVKYLSELKVIDAPILFKLYEIYRYKV